MDEWPPFVPYLILAAICALASFGIVAISMAALSHGNSQVHNAMESIAAMAFAPAALGVGIAAFMSRDRS